MGGSMKYTLRKRLRINFLELGRETMENVGDEIAAKDICALQIHAYADELQPEITDLTQTTEHRDQERRSLWTHCYDRPVPVSDAKMLAFAVETSVLAALITFTASASSVTHILFFSLIGKWL